MVAIKNSFLRSLKNKKDLEKYIAQTKDYQLEINLKIYDRIFNEIKYEDFIKCQYRNEDECKSNCDKKLYKLIISFSKLVRIIKNTKFKTSKNSLNLRPHLPHSTRNKTLRSGTKAFYIVTPEKPKHLLKIGTSEAINRYNNNQET